MSVRKLRILFDKTDINNKKATQKFGASNKQHSDKTTNNSETQINNVSNNKNIFQTEIKIKKDTNSPYSGKSSTLQNVMNDLQKKTKYERDYQNIDEIKDDTNSTDSDKSSTVFNHTLQNVTSGLQNNTKDERQYQNIEEIIDTNNEENQVFSHPYGQGFHVSNTVELSEDIHDIHNSPKIAVVPISKRTQSIIEKELSPAFFHDVNAQKGFTNKLRKATQTEQVEYSNCIDVENSISDIIYGRVGMKFDSSNAQMSEEAVRQFYLSLQSSETIDDFDSDWDDNDDRIDDSQSFASNVQHYSIPLQDILKNPETQNFKWNQIMAGYEINISDISAKERNLQNAKFELVVSEWLFLRTINIFFDQFVQKLFIVLSKNEESRLFAYVKEVKQCSENMLSNLEACWKNNTFSENFCKIILRMIVNEFDVFVHYAGKQVYSESLLGKIVSDKTRTFKDFLDDLQSDPICNGLHLHAYQLVPIRKISSFPVLLQNILQWLAPQDAEYQPCKQALHLINQLLDRCNEQYKQAKNNLRTKSILEKLDFPKNVPLKINIDGDIHMLQFIKSDSMDIIRTSRTIFGRKVCKKNVQVFLFNDIFVVSQKIGCKYTVLDYCFRINLELIKIPNTFYINHSGTDIDTMLYLRINENKDLKSTEIILSCKTKTDALRWKDALDPSDTAKQEKQFNNNYGRKVIAQKIYFAVHSDEINLSIGEIYVVLRDTDDGWSFGQREKDGECGWFQTKNVMSVVSK